MDLVPLCPSDDRRTARELMVKLIIAHFTTVAAFCNYLSLRNYDLASIEPLLFLLCPLLVPIQTLIGLLLISGVFLANIVTGRSPLYHEFSIFACRLRTLLGKKPNKNSTSNLTRSSTESLECGGPGQVAGSRLARGYVTTGRLLLVLGTLFQCVATIFLYKQRVEKKGWESLSAVDFRTFELAVGGAAVSVLSAALLLNLPGFGQMAQAVSGGHVDAALPLFAGDPQRSRRWWNVFYSEKHGIWGCVIPIYALCHLVCMSNGAPVVTRRSHWLMYEVLLQDGIYRVRYIFVPVILGVILASGAWIKGRIDDNTNPSRSDLLEFLLWPSGVYLGFTIVLWLFLSIGMAVMTSIFCVLWVKGSEGYEIWSQIGYAGSADETNPCPMLWKDPVSEYLWSLM
ncbi:hypothetical protein ACHAPT_011550 [Fusarium lateritium]